MRLGYFDELPLRAFQPIGKHMTLWGKSDPAPSPDYAAAANATAAGNLEATRAAAAANRVNQVTPYGSLTYTHDSGGGFNQAAYDAAMKDYQQQLAQQNSTPANGRRPMQPRAQFTDPGNPNIGWIATQTLSPAQQNIQPMQPPIMPTRAQFTDPGNPDTGWTATQTLSPAQQNILNSTNSLNQGLMDTAGKGLSYANDVLSKPGVDTSTLPQVGINPGQSYQDAMMSRLRPQIDRENIQSDAQLANQGITQGSEAYNNAKTLLGQQHNDLLNNATVQGFNTGLSANQNAFQQSAYNQMQPINLINALRTGSQVQNPNFASIPQQQTTAGPDLLGAANAKYNAQLGNVNAQNAQSGNMMNGLFSLGSSALLASDRRLKTNINHIRTRDDGLHVYEFEYLSGFGLPEGKQTGLMADEVEKVMPEAVFVHPSGYKMVDYSLTGV